MGWGIVLGWKDTPKNLTKQKKQVFCAKGERLMEHRHIDIRPGQWGVAVIHSIWERGTDEDIKALIRAVKTDPKAADAVRRAIPHSQVYGFPKFFKMFLEKIDEKR